jgi:hypothetical protein
MEASTTKLNPPPPSYNESVQGSQRIGQDSPHQQQQYAIVQVQQHEQPQVIVVQSESGQPGAIVTTTEVVYINRQKETKACLTILLLLFIMSAIIWVIF